MLTSPFKFLGFNRQAKTPKSAPLNDKKTKGKLRKARNPNTPVDIVDRSTSMKVEEKADISTVHPEEKDSGEYYEMQVRTNVFRLQLDKDNPYSPPVYYSTARRLQANPISTLM